MNNQTDYNHQFNKVYQNRLETIRSCIHLINDIPICSSIFEVSKQKETCVVIGTLFMSSDLKETIFDKINPYKNKEKISCNTYCSEEIKWFLEDETAKIELKIQNKEDLMTTGMVLGVVGHYQDTAFNVQKVIYPAPLKASLPTATPKVAFLSNSLIDLGDNKLMFSILCDYLMLNNITRLVLIGRFFEEDFIVFKKAIDGNNLDLVLIPEHKDFECRTFPVLPVHPKLFTKSFKSYENPSIFDLDGLKIGVTSPYIIQDILKYSSQGLKNIQGAPENYRMHFINTQDANIETENKFESTENILNGLHAILRCRHLSPNSPDTVPGVPFTGKDTCFIDQPLNFLLVQNNEFGWKTCKETNTTMFTVPDFANSKEIIVLDEKNNLKIIKFDHDSLRI